MLSKAQILDHVWQYDFGGDGGVVETYIGYLRRKLDTDRAEADHDGPRRRLHDPHRERARGDPAVAARPPAGRDGARRRRPRRRRRSSSPRRRARTCRAGRRPARRGRRRLDAHHGDGWPRPPVRRTAPYGDRLSDVYEGAPRRRRRARSRSTRRTCGDGEDRRRPTSTPDAGGRAARRRASRSPIGAVGDDDLRYRVRVSDGSATGPCWITALPLDRRRRHDPPARSSLEVVAHGDHRRRCSRAVAWWVVRLGIRPIKQMTAHGRADRRRRPLPPRAGGRRRRRRPGSSASPSTTCSTSLDDGVHRASRSREDRLRRFVADASHELRTPVTTIRGYAELYRVGGLTDARRAGRGDAPHRAGGGAHGPPRRRPADAWPSSTRAGRWSSGRSTSAGSSPTPPATPPPSTRPADHDRARRAGRRRRATRTGCAR